MCAVYYDKEYEIKKREEFTNEDDLVVLFLNKLLTYYVNKEYEELEKILIGNKETSRNHIYRYSYNNSDSAKYIDEQPIIERRVWIDEETRKTLKILYWVCRDKNKIITLNNKIVKLWLFETGTEMSKIFYKMKDIKCNHDYRINLKIEKDTWESLVNSCELLSTTVPEGFKACVNEFVEQKAKQYL